MKHVERKGAYLVAVHLSLSMGGVFHVFVLMMHFSIPKLIQHLGYYTLDLNKDWEFYNSHKILTSPQIENSCTQHLLEYVVIYVFSIYIYILLFYLFLFLFFKF
jgi:hypothetical protein